MTHPHAASSSHGGGHPGAAVDPNGLAMMLRTGTQDLHDQAESGDFQQRMVDGKLVRDEFVAFLQQIWHVHAAMEPLLRSAAGSEPRLGAMLEADHYRLEKIEGDLRDLGAERSDERLDSTKRFIASIETLASDNPLALVGVLYVNEGATNGNKIVAMRIRESLGLDHSIPLGYLDPHGAEQRKRWMAFRGQLDALEMSDAEKRQCVDAARATFQLFMDLSAELSSGPAASAS